MRGISWLAANPVSFSRTLLHGVSKCSPELVEDAASWDFAHPRDVFQMCSVILWLTSASLANCLIIHIWYTFYPLPSQNSLASNHLNIHNDRGLTLCPSYTPSWPYIIVCPQATSEFIQEHIAIYKYSFIALHYDGPTSLVIHVWYLHAGVLLGLYTHCLCNYQGTVNSVIHVKCIYNQQHWHIFLISYYEWRRDRGRPRKRWQCVAARTGQMTWSMEEDNNTTFLKKTAYNVMHL